MFGVFNRRSNKSSKRVNRKRRTSKRRTNRRRRQRGGNADYASAYGSANTGGEDAEGFASREMFANKEEAFEAPVQAQMKGEEAPVPQMKGEEQTGGAGKGLLGGRRRRRGGRKNQGSEMLVPAALLAANLYGPGSAKSRRNRRKSRRNRSQRRRR